MRPLLETHPRAAPWIAGLLASLVSLLFAALDKRPLLSAMAEAVVLGVAVSMTVQLLRRDH